MQRVQGRPDLRRSEDEAAPASHARAGSRRLGSEDSGWQRSTEWVAQTTPNPNPAYHTATVADLVDLQWVNGLQNIVHLYGYDDSQDQSQWMDNNWGEGSRAGLQRFLDQNNGGSLAAWLTTDVDSAILSTPRIDNAPGASRVLDGGEQ